MNQKYILLLLFVISIELLYLCFYQPPQIEGMSALDDESIKNLSSLLNNKKMTVTDLEVTGTLKTNNIDTMTNDWLRINRQGSGKIAIWGGVAIDGVHKGHSGLHVGSHADPKLGDGEIQATNIKALGKIKAVSGTIPDLTANNINTTPNHDWLRVNDKADSAGRLAVVGGVAINRDVEKTISGVSYTYGGLSLGDWTSTRGKGNLYAKGDIGSDKTLRSGDWTLNGVTGKDHASELYNSTYRNTSGVKGARYHFHPHKYKKLW